MHRIKLGSTGRGFLYIFSGTVGSQIIAFIALPILSRIFSPEAFGYYSFSVAIAGIVIPFATLRFELAALLPTKISEVRAISWNAIFSIIGITVITIMVLQFVIYPSGMIHSEEYPTLSLWVAMIIIPTSVYSLVTQLALRNQEYKLVAQRTLYQSIAMNSLQLSLGFAGFLSHVSLIFGHFLGRLVGIVAVFKQVKVFFGAVSLGSIGEAWRKYWKFPSVFAPSAILNSAGSYLPIIFLTAFFGIEIGGQIGMAERIVAIPVSLIGASLGEVVGAEISDKIRGRSGGYLSSYLRYSVFLSVLALLMVIGFVLLGEWVIPWFLGEQWHVAGLVTQIIALTYGAKLIASPQSKIIILFQKTVANIALDSFRIITMLICIGMVVVFDLDIVSALWLIYSSLTATYIVTWIYVLFLVQVESRRDNTLPGNQ